METTKIDIKELGFVALFPPSMEIIGDHVKNTRSFSYKNKMECLFF